MQNVSVTVTFALMTQTVMSVRKDMDWQNQPQHANLVVISVYCVHLMPAFVYAARRDQLKTQAYAMVRKWDRDGRMN